MNPRVAAVLLFGPPAAAAAFLAAALPGMLAGGEVMRVAANLAALTALSLLPPLFFLGSKSPLALRALGPPGAFRLHRALGLLFPALLLVHAGLHVRRLATALGISFPQAALAVPDTWEMVLGKAALGLFLAAWGAALMGTSGRLSRRVWRPVHLAVYLAAPAAFVHALFRGEGMTRGWLLATWAVAALAWTAAAGWRAWRAWRASRFPVVRPSDL